MKTELKPEPQRSWNYHVYFLQQLAQRKASQPTEYQHIESQSLNLLSADSINVTEN